MDRLAVALLALAAAGCAPPDRIAAAGGDFMVTDSDSFNAHLVRSEDGGWMLTVGHGGDIENTPRIFLDGAPAELRPSRLSGFGLYYETTYELARPGVYRIEQRAAPADEKPRAVFSFTIR